MEIKIHRLSKKETCRTIEFKEEKVKINTKKRRTISSLQTRVRYQIILIFLVNFMQNYTRVVSYESQI